MLSTWLFSGAFFSFVWALGLFVTPGTKTRRLNPAWVILLSGLWQLSGAFGGAGAVVFNPLGLWFKIGSILTELFILPALMLLGPLLYRYFREVLSRNEPIGSISVVHLIPAGIVAAAALIYQLSGSGFVQTGFDLRAFLFASPKASIICYLVFLGMRITRAAGHTTKRSSRIIVQLLAAVIFIALALGLAGFIAGNPRFQSASAALLPAIVAGMFIVSRAFPELTGELAQGLLRYSRSRLTGLNIEEIHSKIDTLVHRDKVYADEDLTLRGLADQTGLTAHQLSEFLNVQLGLTYSEFINNHRIEAAKEFLINDPKRTTLSIAFAVGYNSKSSFYRAFRKRTGMDPSKFRANR